MIKLRYLRSLCYLTFSLLIIAALVFTSATPTADAQETEADTQPASNVAKSDAFETSIASTYTVNNQGDTAVNHQVELKNNYPNLYVTEYSFSIGSTRIKNINASANHGPVETKVISGENTTNIQISFEKPLVGKDQTLTFNLNYQNEDIADLLGKVLEIHIPQIANVDKIQNYSLNLNVPLSFGPASIINPQPASLKQTTYFTTLTFSKSELSQSGISAFFGRQQIFSFTINYHLKNPSIKSAQTQIALPPDTPYQHLVYDLIEPAPTSFGIDSDGNWLATYPLNPQQKLLVTAKGKAILYFSPQQNIPQLSENLNQLLLPQPYWPVNHPHMQTTGANLETPQEIYRFVVNTLDYDYARINTSPDRQGALKALANPHQAICQEFTDLFITLSRAAGIPARAINGFAYTTNPKLRPLSLAEDILHSWPEYYDQEKQLWVPVDPTWEKTTGGIDYFNHWDLNHFTFVIHGQNSQEPPPAGAYKDPDQPSKDIQVEFSAEEPELNQEIAVEFDFPSFATAGFPTAGNIRLVHAGNAALYNLNLMLKAPGNQLLSDSELTVEHLLPFSAKIMPVKLKNQNFLSTSPIKITLKINNQQNYSHEIPVKVFIQSPAFLLLVGFVIFTGICVAASIFVAPSPWRLLVSFLKKRGSLRRQSQKS